MIAIKKSKSTLFMWSGIGLLFSIRIYTFLQGKGIFVQGKGKRNLF